MKICHACNTQKPFSEFYKNSCRNDSVATQCKDCHKLYLQKNKQKIKKKQRKNYLINREKILIDRKKYQDSNKEKINSKRREQYKKKDKTKIALAAKLYRLKNKDKIKRKKQEYVEKNKEVITQKNKDKYQKNKQIIREKGLLYRQNNKDKIRARSKEYYERNKEKIKQKSREYDKKNRIIVNEKRRIRDLNRRRIDINYKLSVYLRCRLRSILRISNIHKTFQSHVKFLGCSAAELKSYLESKFEEGMTWDNYGFYGWHIDHILPLSKFDLTNQDEVKRACHYTNLQPLWAKDNLIKADKIIYDD